MAMFKKPGMKTRLMAGVTAGILGATAMMTRFAEAKNRKPVAAKIVPKQRISNSRLEELSWRYGDFGGETGLDIRFQDINRDFKNPVERKIITEIVIQKVIQGLGSKSWRSDLAYLRSIIPKEYRLYFELKLKQFFDSQKRAGKR